MRNSIMSDMSVLSTAMPPALEDSSCMRHLLKCGLANESLRDTLDGTDQTSPLLIRAQNLSVPGVDKASIDNHLSCGVRWVRTTMMYVHG
jgi:hypothetical protein